MPNALDVANAFIKLAEPEVGDVVSNLKVQKLVYYAQGFHLALEDKVLFNEPILAWEHGPVVEELYHHFKEFGANGLPCPEDFDAHALFTKDQIELIKEVNSVYGQYSAWKLRNLTHSERPWIETVKNHEIDIRLLKEYFKTLIIRD